MADDALGDKTEAPTQQRLTEARERGQVPRSQDLTAALMLMASVGVLYFASGFMGKVMMDMLRRMLQIGDVAALSSQSVFNEFVLSSKEFFMMAGPMMGVLALVGIGANLVQSAPVVSGHPLTPSLDKLNPITGFGRIFSKRSLARLVSSILKLIAIVWVSYVAIIGDADRIMGLADVSIARMLSGGADLVLSLSLKLAVVLLVLALIDYIYQRWQFNQDLKMTKQEVREEMKRMEGDPLIKEQRRHIQRQMAMHRMSAEVPKADVIVTNPTHVAVAIKYDSSKMAAPQVVAKGADLLARKIREIAMEHRVPIVEKPALARALYKQVEVGQEVPMEFYKSIAEVLAFVYRLSNRTFNPNAA